MVPFFINGNWVIMRFFHFLNHKTVFKIDLPNVIFFNFHLETGKIDLKNSFAIQC